MRPNGDQDYSSNGTAGFPLVQAAPLHSLGSAKGGPYTSKCFAYRMKTTHQYGALTITDDGTDRPVATAH